MELSSRLNRSMWLDNGSVRQTLWTMVELLILIHPFERTQVAPNTLYALYLLSGLDHCFLVIDAVSMPLIDALLSEAVCLGCSNYLIDNLLVLPLTSVGSQQSCLLPSFTLRFPKVAAMALFQARTSPSPLRSSYPSCDAQFLLVFLLAAYIYASSCRQ